MKKLIFILLIAFMSTNAYAGTITFDSGATITDSYLDNTFYNVYNEINGNLDTDNLADGAVTSDDIATAANPLVRDAENIGEYVYTGITLPSTGASATATISAGTAYVKNDGDDTLHRVVTAATTVGGIQNLGGGSGCTISNDNWVYLDFTGRFSIKSVATGAVQPSTPSNNIVLGYITTDGSNDISSATETVKQTTPPNLRIYTDFIQGCVISRDVSDADVINVLRGNIEFGTGSDNLRRNTDTIDIDFSGTGEGGLDTGTLAQGYYYIWVYPDPDTSSNFVGIASLSAADPGDIAGTDNDDYARLIGWCYASTLSTISPDSVGAYKGLGSSAPNIVRSFVSADFAITGSDWTSLPGMETRFYSSGRPVQAMFSATFSDSTTQNGRVALFIDSVNVDEAYFDPSDAEETTVHLHALEKIDDGEHTIDVKAKRTGGTLTQKEGPRVLIVEEK